MSASPVAVACTCASTKAGVSSAPSPAMVRSAAGASAALPSQAIRPSTTCTARPGRSPTVTSVTSRLMRDTRGSTSDRTPWSWPVQIEGQGGMSGRVAVADQHRHVRRHPLRAQGGRRERRRHGEEDHGAPLGRGQDGAVLGAGDVDADHGDVGRACPTAAATASGSVASATTTRSARPAPRRAAASASVRTRPVSSVAAGRAGGGQAEAAGLARGAQHGDRPRPGALDHAGGGRRGPADVEHRQRDRVGQVVGQDRGDRPREEDRRPLGRHLLRPAVPAGQTVGDPQRGEGERDQRGHPVADGAGPAATPGRRRRRHRSACRPSRSPGSASSRGSATMSRTRGPHGLAVAGARLRELAEGGGVEVQPLYRDAHLVGADRAGRRRAAARPGAARPAGSSTRCTPERALSIAPHHIAPVSLAVTEEPIATTL